MQNIKLSKADIRHLLFVIDEGQKHSAHFLPQKAYWERNNKLKNKLSKLGSQKEPYKSVKSSNDFIETYNYLDKVQAIFAELGFLPVDTTRRQMKKREAGHARGVVIWIMYNVLYLSTIEIATLLNLTEANIRYWRRGVSDLLDIKDRQTEDLMKLLSV